MNDKVCNNTFTKNTLALRSLKLLTVMKLFNVEKCPLLTIFQSWKLKMQR